MNDTNRRELAFVCCVTGAAVSGLGLVLHIFGLGVRFTEMSVIFFFLFLATYGGLLWRADVRRHNWVLEHLGERERELAIKEREARLLTAADPAQPVEPEPDGAIDAKHVRRERWLSALRVFFTAGDRAGGFSESSLRGVVGSDGWKVLTGYGRAHGLLRDAGSNVGHCWGHGMTLARVLERLTALPLPPGEPPSVTPLPNSAARRSTAQKSATQIGETT